VNVRVSQKSAQEIRQALQRISDTAGSGGGDAADITYPHNGFATVEEALNSLFYVTPIASMTATPSTAEVGSTVNDLTLDWTYNKTIVTQSIDQSVGSITPASVRTKALTSLGLTSALTWTLTGNDGTTNATDTAALSFLHKRRYGVSATATPDQALIAGLTAEYSATRVQTRSMTASSQYLYFAWPAAFGEPSFTVNGLPVTGWVKTVVNFTNGSGYATDFWAYRSEYTQNGSGISVVVS
jgi:hypothetical protein